LLDNFNRGIAREGRNLVLEKSEFISDIVGQEIPTCGQ
jgi:hypothetical protein